jgi:hypothetical protein
MSDSRRGRCSSWGSCVAFVRDKLLRSSPLGFYQILKQLPAIVDKGRTGERVAPWPYAIDAAKKSGLPTISTRPKTSTVADTSS